jgi:hypothetical protein
MSWRDYLIYLLHIGAEIEHALMVQYLYAAYSLGGTQVPEKHRPMVERWRKSLLIIAREEMGHLLSVQNVLCLIGGPISFEREDYPWDTPYYPFPFQLEPLSLTSLSCYVYAEMPEHLTVPTGRRLAKRYREFEHADKARIAARVKKVARGGQPHHVGQIYDAIIELVSDTTKIPDSCFNPGTLGRQASWDDWGRGYQPGPRFVDAEGSLLVPANLRVPRVIVAQMVTRTEAIAALKDVAGQGEAPELGLPNAEPSHFDRFLEVYQEFERIRGWSPVRHVPVNPTTGDPGTASKEQTPIGATASRLWANLFNLRYRMLLTYLTHVYRLAPATPRPEQPILRGPVIHRAFGEMYNLKAIAAQLVDLPLDNPRSPRRAGPTFEMPYTLTLPDAGVDCWRLHRDLVVASRELGAELAPQASADGARYLATLADLDRLALEWIDQILTGHSARRHSA